MDALSYRKSFSGLVADNRLKNLAIALLAVTNLIAVFGWARTRETVVLIPPQLDERVEVAFESASQGYQEAWGLFIAQLTGNVSPGNADFVVESLSGLLSADMFRSVQDVLARQVQDIKDDSLAVAFEPVDVQYEVETRKVFVVGRARISGPAGKPREFSRTYELQVSMRFGKPWVTHFDVYEGRPRTLAYLETNPSLGTVKER